MFRANLLKRHTINRNQQRLLQYDLLFLLASYVLEDVLALGDEALLALRVPDGVVEADDARRAQLRVQHRRRLATLRRRRRRREGDDAGGRTRLKHTDASMQRDLVDEDR